MIQSRLVTIPKNRLRPNAAPRDSPPIQKVGKITTSQRHESVTNQGIKAPINVIPVSLEIAKPSTRLAAKLTIIIAIAQLKKVEIQEIARIFRKESVDKPNTNPITVPQKNPQSEGIPIRAIK